MTTSHRLIHKLISSFFFLIYNPELSIFILESKKPLNQVRIQVKDVKVTLHESEAAP